MAVGSLEEFDIWLNGKLKDFEADENVFGSYIRGILEGEESADDKKEALESLLSEMTENDISTILEEILNKWESLKKGSSSFDAVIGDCEEVDVKLARLMESQARAATIKPNTQTAEEKRIREAILTQYGQCSDDENETTSTAAQGNVPTGGGLEPNQNAALVLRALKEKREQSKIESQKKKEKDKEDREKQKQMQADKKEKRKTQKGERRR